MSTDNALYMRSLEIMTRVDKLANFKEQVRILEIMAEFELNHGRPHPGFDKQRDLILDILAIL